MNILIIDNHTEHLSELLSSLNGHNLEVQKYQPGLEFHTDGKDMVLLSGGGGEGKEISDEHLPGHLWYEDEIKFIQTTELPIVGICMGFELVAHAFGAKVEKLPRLVSGFRKISSSKGTIRQFESHRFGIKNVPTKHFEVVAKSSSGVELVRHRSKPIIASQFHPEVDGGTVTLPNLLKSLATS